MVGGRLEVGSSWQAGDLSSALMGGGESGWRSATSANTGGPPGLPPPVSVHERKLKLAIQVFEFRRKTSKWETFLQDDRARRGCGVVRVKGALCA